jgi:hypothetical protein
MFYWIVFSSLFLVSLFSINCDAQNAKLLHPTFFEDSSYYHLAKINDNEYWACGEGGVLTSFDSSGGYRKMPFSLGGKNILKAERFENTVFIASDDATIFKFNLIDSALTRVDIKGFKSKCFYDFQIFPDGKILLCGGSTAISRAKRKLPKGFIALSDTSLKIVKTVWKSYRKFPWSVCKSEGDLCYASVFNGVNTTILKSKGLLSWRKHSRVKGLVHDLRFSEGDLYYVGAASYHFTRLGLMGTNKLKRQSALADMGCVWSQELSGNTVMGCTQSGEIISFSTTTGKRDIKFSGAQAIYDFKLLPERKILVVGHGMYAAILSY